MSADRIFLQRATRNVEESPAYQPISRVRIIVGQDDAGNPVVCEAGSDSGRTVELQNPWGTDAIAQNILQTIQGYAYKPFQADGAMINPAAEIGDAVSVADVYSVIADIETTFSSLMSANIGAPSDGAIDHEYPYESSEQRELERSLDTIRTSFIVELGRISMEVADLSENEQGLSNRITQVELTADGIRADLSADYLTADQVANSISAAITVSAQSITSEISRDYELKTDATAKLNTAKQYADTQDAGVKGTLRSEIAQTAESIKATVAAQEDKWDLSQLPSGVEITAFGYGIPSNNTAAQYINQYYLDQSTGRYYRSNGTSWVRQSQQLQLVTSNLQSAIELNADQIRSVVSDMSATQYAVSEISQRIDNITMYVSSANGSTTFTLTDGSAVLDTKTFEVTVDSFNVVGPITATSVAANAYLQAPEIYGGMLYDASGNSALVVGGSGGSYGDLALFGHSAGSSSYWPVFSVTDQIGGTLISAQGVSFGVFDGSGNFYAASGTVWDFRGATVLLPS